MDLAQIKSLGGGGSQFKFGVLAKIVRHMKARHMEGDDHPLNLEEILDETNQLDVGNKTKNWLATEALKNNPRMSANPDGTFIYKPPYDIRNKKGFMKLLRKHDLKGLGGIFLEDIQVSKIYAVCASCICELIIFRSPFPSATGPFDNLPRRTRSS